MHKFREKLKKIAMKIAYFQSQLIIWLVYYVIIAPFALALRLFKDPLNLRGGPSWSRFSETDRPVPTPDWVKRQF